MKKIIKTLCLLAFAALSFSCSNLFDETLYGTGNGTGSGTGTGTGGSNGTDPTSTKIPTSLKGTGTAAKPFLIYTIGDMYYFAEAMSTSGKTIVAEDGSKVKPKSASYKLMNDLDFNSKTWKVLSNSYEYNLDFTGDFDGNYHTIKNITSTNGGFFWDMGSSGIVRNLNLQNCTFGKSGWASFSAFGGNVKGTLIGINFYGKTNNGSQILATNGTLVGCCVKESSSSSKAITSSSSKYGVTKNTSGDVDTLNKEIASWNSKYTTSSNKYCNWHYEKDSSGLILVKGAPAN